MLGIPLHVIELTETSLTRGEKVKNKSLFGDFSINLKCCGEMFWGLQSLHPYIRGDQISTANYSLSPSNRHSIFDLYSVFNEEVIGKCNFRVTIHFSIFSSFSFRIFGTSYCGGTKLYCLPSKRYRRYRTVSLQVRVTWHFIFDATRVIARPMHVDGISVYSLNAKGLVRRHDLETIIVNGTPAKPPFAQAWLHPPSWITKGLNGGVAAPGLSSYSSGSIGGGVGGVGGVGVGVDAASFRSGDGGREGEAAAVLAPLGFFPTRWRSFPSALDSAAIIAGMVAATRVRMPPPPSTGFGFDEGVLWAFSEGVGAGEGESSEEDLEGYLPRENGGGEVETGEAGEGGEARDSGGKKAPAKDTLTKKKKKKKKGFWPIEYDGPLGCETSWDCTGGYVCCDLLVVRICCSNGVMQRKPGDLIPVLTPIPGRGRTELDQFEPMPTR